MNADRHRSEGRWEGDLSDRIDLIDNGVNRVNKVLSMRPGVLVAFVATWLLLLAPSASRADSVRESIREGNGLYGEGKYSEAINKYNEALVEQPQALEPKFNKAGSYYRMDDLGEALDLYQEVAAKSKDMDLVAKAKYNVGNCFFQRGVKQRDSDLQKAVDDMKTSITYWRQVLELEPKNEKAARNIEVARLTIKDILDQLKKQQEQQKQQNQQDPNQPNQQQQQQQQNQQQQQDPNQPKDPNQPQDSKQSQDPNQPKQGAQPQDPNQSKDKQDQQKQSESQPQQDQNQRPEQKFEPDATAQEIIDTEQRQKKEREVRQREQYRKVEKDW